MTNKITNIIDRIKSKLQRNNELYSKKTTNIAFKFEPFSIKQKKVLTWWCDNSPVKDKDGIIADGAIRSGKTISMSMSFGIWSMTNFNNQNFLIMWQNNRFFKAKRYIFVEANNAFTGV